MAGNLVPFSLQIVRNPFFSHSFLFGSRYANTAGREREPFLKMVETAVAAKMPDLLGEEVPSEFSRSIPALIRSSLKRSLNMFIGNVGIRTSKLSEVAEPRKKRLKMKISDEFGCLPEANGEKLFFIFFLYLQSELFPFFQSLLKSLLPPLQPPFNSPRHIPQSQNSRLSVPNSLSLTKVPLFPNIRLPAPAAPPFNTSLFAALLTFPKPQFIHNGS